MNYQKELEKRIEKSVKNQEGKRLLLHSCCAPCSSYVLEYLKEFFEITVFYYNPNITEREEYQKRVEEQRNLIVTMNGEEQELSKQIKFIEGTYEPKKFFDMVKGLEQCLEGGKRCHKCFELRLQETAVLAKKEKFDYFVTSLTISPLKDAEKLNQIGQELGEKFQISFLPSDFKKKNGYLRSIELTEQYHLYRQDYCGCIYSKGQRNKSCKKKGFRDE